MHRQSLGSPGSKQHLNGGAGGLIEASLTDGAGNFTGRAPEDEDEIKASKPIRSTSNSPRNVHWIPILILLCFLILYMISHEPAHSDLPSTTAIERIVDQKAGSVSRIVTAAIGTKRDLMEEKNQLRNRRLGNSAGR